MNEQEKESGKKERNWKMLLPALILAAVIVLIGISRWYLSYLDKQLFEERSTNIVEFTNKASEIVDNIIEYSWQQVLACEYAVRAGEITSREELLAALVSTNDFIDGQNSIVLALNQNGNYYSSDAQMARWSQLELLSAKADATQQIVAEIPHKGRKSYFIFMERLDTPIAVGTAGEEITHLALAVEITTMRDEISVSGFGDQCYTYLVNQDGRRLYKYTYTDNFIEGYNVLNAFQDYEIVHGGTYEEFIQALEQGESKALEFIFVEEDGTERKWYVANAPISSQNWQVLLFVPTRVLGAGTMQILNGTIWFFAMISVLFLILIAIILVVTMLARADKRLVRQKDEANKLLKTAAEEANSANQAKSDFLSHMSHDIRTPINGIMGMTDIALKHIGNQEKVQDCLNKISGSSQHLLGLINDVLDMSRIESGKTKANHESFDIRTCIDNCVSIIGGQLATRDIELIKDCEDFTHPALVGDELHLRQVFINILGNSVKFTPDGGKIYFIAREIKEADGRVLFRFELTDTGIGMKPEFLPRLFEAFSQEDGGTRTTYKGTGLGMAITKKFIDMMGGTIEVESTLNVGTKFVIELWIDIDYEVKSKVSDSDNEIDLKGMKVLLVEDIELNMEVAQSILEEKGILITPAMNGQEAVDAFVNHPAGTFDLILMDIMMPVMNGLTAARTIRDFDRLDAKTIPIVAMTANAYEEDIRNTQEAGMNAHLSKPIDSQILFKTLSGFYSANKQMLKQVELAGLKILLADDMELNLEIAKSILEEGEAVVTTVENGQEAVDVFLGNPEDSFDVILMDVHMPVMDGLEATKRIRALDRQDAKTVPILAMTADVYEEDVQRTKEAGMDGHLTKPLDVEKMLSVLSECRRNL